MSLKSGPAMTQNEFEQIASVKEKIKASSVKPERLKAYIVDKSAVEIARLEKIREEAIREKNALLIKRQQVVAEAAKRLAPNLPTVTGSHANTGSKFKI
jgi:hypothetical protein